MHWNGQEGSVWIGRGGDPSALATQLGDTKWKRLQEEEEEFVYHAGVHAAVRQVGVYTAFF